MSIHLLAKIGLHILADDVLGTLSDLHCSQYSLFLKTMMVNRLATTTAAAAINRKSLSCITRKVKSVYQAMYKQRQRCLLQPHAILQ